VVGILLSFQFTINKALIAWGFDEATVGREYGLAAVVLTVLMVVPGAVGVTSYPSMLQLYGATGKASALRRRILKQSFRVGLFSAAVAAAGWMLLPAVVRVILPAYEPGVETARWILPGVAFFSASIPSTYFLQTIRHQRQHLVVSSLGLAVQVALVVLMIREGGGVVEVAKVTSLAYALYALTLFSVFLYSSRERADG
jgi:O-antigen/teichoic acid export membrane protein